MHRIIILLIGFTLFTRDIKSQTICVGESGQIRWEVYRGLYDDEINELITWPDFPYHPYDVKTLYSSKSPVNYDNAMGAMMRGFISVPSSDTVTFNLTGNEQARFYLSSNENPSNKALRAYLNANTTSEEHNKFPTQTSVKIYLQAGINYYFEILYVDGTGGDFANLFWKTNLVDALNWKPITSGFLKNIACLTSTCPKSGTPCNDGDATTINDIEDGQCHCSGKKTTNNTCIGDRFVIENFRYDNVAGSELNDLYMHVNYPAVPSFSEVLPLFGKAITTNTNNGRLTQAYLKVPVSGNYKFNVTGDDQTVLYLSSNDDPLNKQTHQCLVSGFTNPTQHDKYQWQSTSFIYLDSSKYYYIELNSKQSSGNAHFGVFWQTPFGQSGIWKRIPSVYMYKYNCTLACMPQNTPCDDGNIFTNNDVYNENCECLGTPCTGANCNNPLASYQPFEKCNVTDQIDNRLDNNWLSCTKSANPNTARSVSHWIKYDLGEKHRLLTSHIWNYNVNNETNKGFQSVAIDYSSDGITWIEFGTYNWNLASGAASYGGFIGPDFQETEARYLLITSLDADTNSCKGFGKIAIKAIYCPQSGTLCNDQNITTTNDRYNNQCECVGIPLYENLCEEDFLILGDSLLYPTNYSAIQNIQSISTIASSNRTSFIGGKFIELNPGFNSEDAAIFIASIDTCNTTMANSARIASMLLKEPKLRQKELPAEILSINYLNENQTEISYYIKSKGLAKLKILDQNLNAVFTLLDHEVNNMGHYKKLIPMKKLENEFYFVAFENNGEVHRKMLISNLKK